MSNSIPFPLRSERRVEFHQTDAAGLMHFSTYFFWMEAGEADVFRALGQPLMDLSSGTLIGFPRVDASCKFRRPLHFDETVNIETSLGEPLANRLFWQFRFFNAAGELTARGSMTTACVRRCEDHSLQSVAIPPTLLEALLRWRTGGFKSSTT